MDDGGLVFLCNLGKRSGVVREARDAVERLLAHTTMVAPPPQFLSLCVVLLVAGRRDEKWQSRFYSSPIITMCDVSAPRTVESKHSPSHATTLDLLPFYFFSKLFLTASPFSWFFLIF